MRCPCTGVSAKAVRDRQSRPDCRSGSSRRIPRLRRSDIARWGQPNCRLAPLSPWASIAGSPRCRPTSMTTHRDLPSDPQPSARCTYPSASALHAKTSSSKARPPMRQRSPQPAPVPTPSHPQPGRADTHACAAAALWSPAASRAPAPSLPSPSSHHDARSPRARARLP